MSDLQCVMEAPKQAPKRLIKVNITPKPQSAKISARSVARSILKGMGSALTLGNAGCGWLAERAVNNPSYDDGSIKTDTSKQDAGRDFRSDSKADSKPAREAGSDFKTDMRQDMFPYDFGKEAGLDAKSDTQKPDQSKTDTIKTDTIKPDALKPDTLKPDTLKPDTVPPVCPTGTLTSMTETEFKNVSGSTFTNIDYWSLYQSLILKRNWTAEWKADDGALPTWTLNAPTGANGKGTATMTTDSASGGVNVLNMNTLSCTGCTAPPTGSDQQLYYNISPSFTSAGGVVQVVWRLVAPEPSGVGKGIESSIEIANGANSYRPGMTISGIEDTLSTSVSFATDTQSKLFSLRVEFINNTVRYFVNEQGPQAKTNTYVTSNNYIHFSDNHTSLDGRTFIRQIAYYNGGDHVPFYPITGNYAKIFDFSGQVASFKEINFTGTTPALTGIKFETRSGNTATPDISWSSWVSETVTGSTATISSPKARYLQVRPTLETSDNLVSPTLADFTVKACK